MNTLLGRPLAVLRASMATPLMRNAYALIVNTGATSALGFLFWAVAARLYPEAVVGLNSAVITTMILLANLAGLNLQSALTRFIPSAGANAPKLIIYAYLVTSALAVLVGLAFLAGQVLLGAQVQFASYGLDFGLWFILAIVVWIIFMLQEAAMIGLRAAVWVPIGNILFGVAKLGLVVIALLLIPQFGLFAAWTLPVLVSLFPINWLIFRRLVPKFIAQAENNGPPPTPRDLARFVGIDYVGQLLALGSSALLPLIVLEALGPTDNAYFQISWTIAYTPALMAVGMTQSLTVEGATNPTQLRAYTLRIIKQMIVILGPLIIGLALVGPFILAIFGRNYSTEGATLFRLLALSAFPVSISILAVSITRVLKQMHLLLAIAGLSCVLSLTFTFVMVGPFGLAGVGWAYLISQIIVALTIPMIVLYRVLRHD